VKWPNDVVVDGRKISGILSESSTQGSRTAFVVSGIGLNVNTALGDFAEEFRDRTCSCFTLTGTEFNRAEVLAGVLFSLEAVYESFAREGFGPARERYKALLCNWGATIRFEKAGREIGGTVRDVAPDGGLVVETDAGALTLYEEEVLIVRSEGSR
jgi:BirA family biotin operon repressor/biotin-[acetyl-CoA-carboxylase] ligase